MIEIDIDKQESDKFNVDEDFENVVGYDPKLFSSDAKLLAVCLMNINNSLEDIKNIR